MSRRDKSDVGPVPEVPRRPRDAHKGDFGRVLVVAGSRGMSGAASLTAQAALRSGAGLVRVAAPDVCIETIAALHPCYTTIPLPSDDRGQLTLAAADALASELADASVVAIGPGLGRSDPLDELVHRLYDNVPLPMVVDADALNALSDNLPKSPPAARVLTPHPGEFRRLSGVEPGERQKDHALQLAQQHNCIVLLKGADTLITDGNRRAVNTTGNPGMATGGSGDVLTGVIAGLIGQGLDPWDATRLAAHIHGRAGDLASDRLGELSMLASDLLDLLPEAFMERAAAQ